MAKINLKPGAMLYPLPAVLVSCGSGPEEYNLLTISWTGTICSVPPMCSISVRQSRHSYNIIRSSMEFVINLTTAEMLQMVDWCGVRSGKDHAKFAELKLTAVKSDSVKAPLILESPVNIECVVKQVIPLGSHDLFISEVVAVHADETYIDPKTGNVSFEKASLLCYAQGQYFKTSGPIEKFGFTTRQM
ncbi:MAG: flavin reductase family protein [Bacteroidia bacterium]|nr:flavin reductase family protein [Bacteroidia bacterium]